MIKIRSNSKRKLKDYFNSTNLRKNLFYKRILTLSLLFLFFLSSSIINSTQIINEQPKEKLTLIDEHLKLSNQEDDIFKLVYGTMIGPYTLDPQDCWDSSSAAVIDQVCEGLFGYNLSAPDLAIIPKLASDYGTWNGENYTVPLRQGVLFHDGTKFNATAVNFTFNRLAYFMENSLAAASTLYEYYDVDTSSFLPIINHTEIEDEYTIKFVLNKPYGPFEALLCFPGSYILSPASTNATGVIDKLTGDLVGTGPFVYDHYILNDEVKFHAFENYWNGKPNITILKFSNIQDAQVRNNALLSGEVDIITDPMSSMYPIFDTDQDITLFDAGQDLTPQYLGMNNYWINVSFREAISYAINYSYIIEELLEGEAVRLKSPIPEGVRYANWSFNVATYNVSHARMIMQSMGFGVGWDTTYPGTNEAQWQAATFATFNYTYNIGNSFREDIFVLLVNNLDLIGISVTDAGMTWMDYLSRLYEIWPYHRNELQLFWSGWIPDYNDPKTLINNLFTNRTLADNCVKYNGGYGPDGPFQPYGPLTYDQNEDVQLLMEQALFETDPAVREPLYDKIQQLIVERDMPWAFGYVGKNYDAYQNYILGFQSNAMEQLNFHKVYQNSSIAPHNIDIEGNQEWIYLKNSSRCTGSGTNSDPYVLKDLVIDGRNKSVSCIRIKDSDVFFRIENCTFFNSTQAGIEFRNVSNSLLINNNCTNNNYGIYINSNFNVNITANLLQNNSIYGIFLNNTNNDLIFNNTFQLNSNAAIYSEFSNNNTIYDNFINASFNGIYLRSSNLNLLSTNIIQNCSNYGIFTYNCTKNTVIENYLYKNLGGIFDNYGFDNSLLENTVIENTNFGIGLQFSVNITISMNDVIGSSMGGIVMQKLNQSFIINNNISQNGDFGILFFASFGLESINNTISQNTIMNTNETGLGLTTFTIDNLIFSNEFKNNYLNAQDNGTNNQWDNGIIGNNWDDYGGVDINDDGIGDTPYLINGTADSQDNFPIWADGDDITPVITIIFPLPDRIFGLIAPNYNISIDELNLDTIWYTLDGGGTNYTITGLTGTCNQLAWDALPEGNVIIRFYANDSAGNLGFDEVSVQKSIGYRGLDPFIIDDTGLGDYTWAQAATQGWCGGSGTWSNPYIIEYVIINGQNSGSCIEIRNSNVPFIIRNSVMSISGSGDFDAGIKLDHVNNGLLYNITGSSNNNFGIILMDCLNNTITESTINDNGVGGILLYYSDSNSIINNTQTIKNNGKYGILLNSSNSNIISGNYISNCQYGIYFYNSSDNQIIYNIIWGNDVPYEQTAGSDNIIDETNEIGSDGDLPFPTDLLIIISIIAIAAVVSAGGAIVYKKKVSLPKKKKEVKPKLEKGEIITKKKLKIEKGEDKEKLRLEKQRKKIENKLQKKLTFVDDLIKENKTEIALKNLNEIESLAKSNGLIEFVNEAEQKLIEIKKLELDTINRIKQTITNLGTKFSRLQLIDISEKSDVKNEVLIEKIIKEMLNKKEIRGEYFASSKALALEVTTSMITREKKKGLNVFLSYSTLDADRFEISRIVRRLELYSEITKVYFWEADSGANIVTFMEQTLQKTNAFVLFCSEHSIKSKAVEDEWQAAFQLRKEGLMKIVPVYEKDEHLPYLLKPILNVKFSKDDFDGFIQKLYDEILR